MFSDGHLFVIGMLFTDKLINCVLTFRIFQGVTWSFPMGHRDKISKIRIVK